MAGGVIDGTPVDAADTNPKFIFKDTDDTATGKITLNNTADVASGSQVDNIQKELNSEASFTGKALNTAKTDVPSYTYNQGLTAAGSLKVRADELSGKFDNSVGHRHTGAAGDGPQVSAGTIANTPLLGYGIQGTDLTGVTGTSTVVTTQLTGKTPSTSSLIAGVVVNTPYNKVIIRQSTGANQDDSFLDLLGNVIYGRITNAASVWTLSYYVSLSGTETAYTFVGSNGVRWYYQELFNPLGNPPVYTPNFFIPSDNATADILDASLTQRGAVSVGTQSFAGNKTFAGSVEAQAQFYGAIQTDSTSTGAAALLPTPGKLIYRLTNGSLTSVSGVTAPLLPQVFLLRNNTGVSVTITNSNSGANSILTGTGNDFTMQDKSSVFLLYDTTSARWSLIGGGGSGSVGYQEVPTGTVNGTNDTFGPLTFLPSDDNSVIVFVDGIARPKTEWSLTGTLTKSVVFGASFKPQTDQSVYVFYLTTGSASPSPAPTGTWNVEYHTLSSGDATAKNVTLGSSPASPTKVLLDIIGGTPQEYSVDFSVSGSTLTWSGLGLDGFLAAGDKLRVVFIT